MHDPEQAPTSLLLASSVHDIKNSLGMLLNTLDAVIEETPINSDSQRQQFATLRSEAARINHSLIYLLGLYRLQRHELPLQIQEVYVADFLEEQIAANELLFSIRQITVQCDCDESLTAYFDPTLIAGVIGNILVNAAHYAQTTIRIKAIGGEKGSVALEISDDGPGFPEKMLGSNYTHGERGIDFGSGSTNLGLFFAAEVAYLHRRGDIHGTIALSNISPHGSHFKLTLP
ncbi:MAG: HAMP domain-containing sensor histidine kinase [Spongiibacteraceae bacterium]